MGPSVGPETGGALPAQASPQPLRARSDRAASERSLLKRKSFGTCPLRACLPTCTQRSPRSSVGSDRSRLSLTEGQKR